MVQTDVALSVEAALAVSSGMQDGNMRCPRPCRTRWWSGLRRR